MESIRSELTRLSKELIAIPSISERASECRKAIAYMEALFQGTSYQQQLFERNEVYSLVISKQRTLDFSLLFFGHLDVVPGKSEAFSPVEKDGYVFGRGSADMKGACAAMAKLFLDLEHEPCMSDTALIFTTDEEVGGFDGIGYLTRSCGLRAQTVFNPDGGGIYTPCIGQKGIFQFEISTEGASAHGSRPWRGKNAIKCLLEDYRRVEESFLLATQEEQGRVSVNLGKLVGGEAANSVAEHAAAHIDIRFPAPYTAHSIRDIIKKALHHSTFQERLVGDAVCVDEDDPAMQLLLDILAERGHERITQSNNTGSDARWFSEQGSSILLMLPESTAGHIDEEAVSIDGLYELYAICKEFVMRS